MPSSNALDTTIAVVTPENISFDYQLAGPFRRLPAYLIDLAVRWAIVIGLLFAIMMLVRLMDVFSTVTASSMGSAVWMISHFLISWFYGTLMEAFFNGRTVGKWACGIRSISVDGRPISGKSAILRNLLRIADLAPMAMANEFFGNQLPPMFIIPTGLIGVSTMLFTKRLQRLGDLAAGTMVIVDEKTWKLPVAKVDDPRVEALSTFIPGDYRVSRNMARTLAIYAERRHYLKPNRRRDVARHLAQPLIERFQFRPDIDPDLLLYCLYFKTFLADATATPDLGPLAGFSPLLKDMNMVHNEEVMSGLVAPKPKVQPIIESQAEPETTG